MRSRAVHGMPWILRVVARHEMLPAFSHESTAHVLATALARPRRPCRSLGGLIDPSMGRFIGIRMPPARPV